MNILLPLFRQEKDNTCGLACLRMVLAAFGRHVGEADIETQARMEETGIEISELERLALQFGLVAQIQELTVENLQDVLDHDQLPIAYVDRAVFDFAPAERARHSLRDVQLHTVIPVRVTAKSVRYHDPLSPKVTRRSIRLFRQAFDRIGGLCVVCSKGS